VLTVAVLSAGSFALNLILVDSHAKADFYLPLSRFWELGLGSLLAAIELHSKARVEPRDSATRRLHWHSAEAVASLLSIVSVRE
jgi:peptidoglycan/LPS O-acetylase OafA/YrhL